MARRVSLLITHPCFATHAIALCGSSCRSDAAMPCQSQAARRPLAARPAAQSSMDKKLHLMQRACATIEAGLGPATTAAVTRRRLICILRRPLTGAAHGRSGGRQGRRRGLPQHRLLHCAIPGTASGQGAEGFCCKRATRALAFVLSAVGAYRHASGPPHSVRDSEQVRSGAALGVELGRALTTKPRGLPAPIRAPIRMPEAGGAVERCRRSAPAGAAAVLKPPCRRPLQVPPGGAALPTMATLDFKPGKLSLEEYEARRAACTEDALARCGSGRGEG